MRGGFAYILIQLVKRNIAINSAVITQVTTETSLIFPVQIFISTQEIKPTPIPKEMEKPNAITAMVRNAGRAFAGLSQSIFLTADIISTPTQMSTAAVAQEGIIFAMGLKKLQVKSNPPK